MLLLASEFLRLSATKLIKSSKLSCSGGSVGFLCPDPDESAALLPCDVIVVDASFDPEELLEYNKFENL